MSSQSNSSGNSVLHNQEESKFLIMTDERESHLIYQRNQQILNLRHTYVPPEDRGKGLAEKLVITALEYARDNNFAVIPSCSYIDTYIRRHPEWQKIVAR